MQLANFSGKKIEDIIFSLLVSMGIHPQRQYHIGKGIYGTDVYVDFFIDSQSDCLFGGQSLFEEGLIIESKWQDTAGSVDEKYPYLYQNIVRCYPSPTIVVLGGKGIRPGAIRWFKGQVDNRRLLDVFTLDEFISWCIRDLGRII